MLNTRRRNMHVKYCYCTFIICSGKVSYDVPCFGSRNKIELKSNKIFGAWTITGLRTNFDIILPVFSCIILNLIKSV